eukprot:scaffold412545_cov56-Prasinocladus_malaysianus.AAC.1
MAALADAIHNYQARTPSHSADCSHGASSRAVLVGQSIHERANKSVVSQSVIQSVGRRAKQISHLLLQSASRLIGRSAGQQISHVVSQPVSQSDSQSVGRSVGGLLAGQLWSVGQLVSQSAN